MGIIMAKKQWLTKPAAILWVCGCCGGVRLCQCEEGTEIAPGCKVRPQYTRDGALLVQLVPQSDIKVQEVT